MRVCIALAIKYRIAGYPSNESRSKTAFLNLENRRHFSLADFSQKRWLDSISSGDGFTIVPKWIRIKDGTILWAIYDWCGLSFSAIGKWLSPSIFFAGGFHGGALRKWLYWLKK
jgi:hypothetical protein